MRSCTWLLAAVAALAITPDSARAQSAHRDTVVELLAEAARGATETGFRSASRVFDTRSVVGMLPRGGSVVLDANLRAGVRYTVLAVCDGECVDLDLRAHAPDNDEMLDEDVSTDKVPVLTFTATADGPHPVSVIMSECRAELCYFALRVLSR